MQRCGQAESPCERIRLHHHQRGTEGPWDGVVSWSTVKIRSWVEVEGSRGCLRNCARAGRKWGRDIPGFLSFLFSRVLLLKPARKPEGKRARVIPLAGSVFWTGQTGMEKGPGKRSRWLSARCKGQSGGRTLGVAPTSKFCIPSPGPSSTSEHGSLCFSREPV